MRHHALIEKFVGIWPLEKALLWWINVTWKPLEDFHLHLGAKGFEILQKESTQKNPDREIPQTSKDGPKDCKEILETFQDATIEKQTNMQVEEEDTKEMDLGDLNLDKLEKAV